MTPLLVPMMKDQSQLLLRLPCQDNFTDTVDIRRETEQSLPRYKFKNAMQSRPKNLSGRHFFRKLIIWLPLLENHFTGPVYRRKVKDKNTTSYILWFSSGNAFVLLFNKECVRISLCPNFIHNQSTSSPRLYVSPVENMYFLRKLLKCQIGL